MAWTCLPSAGAPQGTPVPSRLEDPQPFGATEQLPTVTPALKLTWEDHAHHPELCLRPQVCHTPGDPGSWPPAQPLYPAHCP